MRLFGSTIRLFTCGLALALITIASPARAAIFSYDLSGVLDSNLGTHTAGTAFTGSFAYDTVGNPDSFASASAGIYTALSVSLTVGTDTVTSTGGTIVIENQVNGGDRLAATGTTNGILGGIVNPTIRWNLRANGGLASMVFGDDSLPDYLLNPADFTANPRLIVFGHGGGVYDSFSGSVSAVPIPAALWLFGSGILGLLAYGRRRQMARL